METDNSVGTKPLAPDAAASDGAAEAAQHLQNDILPATWLNVARGALARIQRTITPPTTPLPQEQKAWLFVVDVTTKDFGGGDNIALRSGQFEKLAQTTRDRPEVAIVVQTALADVEQTALPLYARVFHNPYHVDRYIIRDGVKRVESANSSGLAGDIGNLLSFADKYFNSKHTALIIDSHGAGNEGIQGDTGKSKLDDMIAAIKASLPAGKKLDLLDFDACIMAQNGVLEHTREIADHVVASAEKEGPLGQDLTGPIGQVVKEPQTTAYQLAELMIDHARRQSTPAQDTQFKLRSRDNTFLDSMVQIPTLAHFDLTNYNCFRRELDQFGDALVQAIKDPRARHSIDQIIENTPRYGSVEKKHDLKCFIERVLDEIANKQIPDHNDQLRLHGGLVLDAFKRLVPSYSGFDKYSSRGGLTVFLPKRAQVDFHEFAAVTTAQALLREASNPPDLVEKKAAYIDWLRDHLGYMMNQQIKLPDSKTAPKDIDEVKLAWHRARHAVTELERATDLKATLPALAELRAAAAALIATKFYVDWKIEQERSHKAVIAERFAEQLINKSTGWGRFREALRRLD